MFWSQKKKQPMSKQTANGKLAYIQIYQPIFRKTYFLTTNNLYTTNKHQPTTHPNHEMKYSSTYHHYHIENLSVGFVSIVLKGTYHSLVQRDKWQYTIQLPLYPTPLASIILGLNRTCTIYLFYDYICPLSFSLSLLSILG